MPTENPGEYESIASTLGQVGPPRPVEPAPEAPGLNLVEVPLDAAPALPLVEMPPAERPDEAIPVLEEIAVPQTLSRRD